MELHFHCKVIGKGADGRTACGSSAYRSCSKIIDNAGNVHDYQNKEGHIRGGVELPKGASEELRDQQTLWQRHEIKDRRKDAQLYRDIEFSFPNELDYDAIERVTKKVCAVLTEMGMCAQWDLHDNKEEAEKGNINRNKHVHVMGTMRDLLEDGSFGNKNRSWNKYNGGVNLAELLRGDLAGWMNEELEKIGSSERVEHESFAERGVDRIPEVHLGPTVAALERKGIKTQRGTTNEHIRRKNEEHLKYLEHLAKLREEQQERSRDVLASSENTLGGLDSVIEFAERKKDKDAAGRLAMAKENVYQNIKSCDRQIHALRGEKKKNSKKERALYLIKNLSGDPNLTEEQKAELVWAENYLKWGGMEDVGQDNALAEIERMRKDNYARIGEIIALEKTKTDLYDAAVEIRTQARSFQYR